MGNDVVCCAVARAKSDGLNRGELPIYEPGLDKLVAHNAAEKRLQFTNDIAHGVAGADIILLTVGTRHGAEGSAELAFTVKPPRSVAEGMTGGTGGVAMGGGAWGERRRVVAGRSGARGRAFAVAGGAAWDGGGRRLRDRALRWLRYEAGQPRPGADLGSAGLDRTVGAADARQRDQGPVGG